MLLDQQFGPLIPPQKPCGRAKAWEDWELDFDPTSLAMLDRSTAADLRKFMDDVVAGARISSFLTNDIAILWVVNDAGDVLFAVEELVQDGRPAKVPRHKTIEFFRGAPKMGHPALVRCANARIGGEIYFNADGIPPGWVITNESGRYGMHPSRTPTHLHNVRLLFASMGIEMKEFFVS